MGLEAKNSERVARESQDSLILSTTTVTVLVLVLVLDIY